ncbi:MAG: methyltransferase domain-containing protein [Ilumatobacter sp.]
MDTCPVCSSGDREVVLSLPALPVLINAQVRPEGALDVVRGDMDLAVCTACGHLYNVAFDESLLDYDAAYENTLHFSGHFQKFAAGLRDRLVGDHSLGGATVAELGSGPGHFLSMLCDAGVARGIGYDPSYDADRLGAPEHQGVSISTDLFPADGSLQVALAFSQHVLEHLHDPVAALAAQRSAVTEAGGVVYSEVPNGSLMLGQCALWDLIYEHLSYFVPTSLDLACRRAGLSIDTMDTAFGDQFLWCEAEVTEPDPTATPSADAVASAVEAARAFGVAATARIAEARQDLARFAAAGPVALWGAGSKGMTYLNLMTDPDTGAAASVAAVVDINPRKAGWGVPGTSLTITEPESLTAISPTTVLIANPVYADEISATLVGLGVEADVLPLWKD